MPQKLRHRRRHHLAVRVVLAMTACAVLVTSACGGAPTIQAPRTPAASAPPARSVPTVLILDASGSMIQTDAPGPRIAAAKAAAHSLINALPDGATIGLETYGTKTGSADGDRAAGCRDVTTLLPLRPLDRSAVGASIERIVPSGYTPISLALETAVDQLPGDGTPRAVVLVSDGEDTCDAPPCDTAARLEKSHSGLTISTVGFKVDGPAADQLRCIARAAGGVFVEAANASQLAARLLATQNLDQANQSLSSTGSQGVDLGAKIGDIKAKYPDFPDVSPNGAVSVVWRDCDFGFVDGAVDSITPHDGGRTIDGVTLGSPVTKATELYGAPMATSANPDGSTAVIFDADPHTDAAYDIGVEGFISTNGAVSGTVKKIVLCRCKPRAAPVSRTEQIVIKPVDGQGNTMPGYLKDEGNRDEPIDCGDGLPSPYDVTRGVRLCGITADSGDACWPTAGGAYVLCLTNPFKNVLTLRAATGTSTPLPPPDVPPTPMGLVLDDGTQCRARAGGAWPFQDQHHDWVGYFSCSTPTPDDFSAVWAPSGPDGIDRGPDGWTVQVGGVTGPVQTRGVAKAYFVGVA